MTWEELRQRLREALELRRDEPDLIELAWSFAPPDLPGGPFSVQQRVFRGQKDLAPFVLVVSPVMPEAERPARDLLMQNMRTEVGALALWDGHYVMRLHARLDELDPRRFVRDLELLAREAMRLRVAPDRVFEPA
jgi:hypothetical protein